MKYATLVLSICLVLTSAGEAFAKTKRRPASNCNAEDLNATIRDLLQTLPVRASERRSLLSEVDDLGTIRAAAPVANLCASVSAEALELVQTATAARAVLEVASSAYRRMDGSSNEYAILYYVPHGQTMRMISVNIRKVDTNCSSPTEDADGVCTPGPYEIVGVHVVPQTLIQ